MAEFPPANEVNTTRRSIGIIIPVFEGREEDILLLLDQLVSLSVNYRLHILIVDDGSSSPVHLKKYPDEVVRLIRHPVNRGKGEALKTGFSYFSGEYTTDLILTIDADLQHPVSLIPQFISAYETGKGEMIIGYRRRKPGIMPLSRIISNTLTSLIISMLTGQLIRDSQCGFRLMKTSLLNHLLLTESRFHLESEMLIRLGWQKVGIGFSEIPTLYEGEKSSINHIQDTLNFVCLIFRLVIERMLGNVRAIKT